MLVVLFLIVADVRAINDPMQNGVMAFQNRQWGEAMSSFLDVLSTDPQNSGAHAYLNLTIRELETQQHSAVSSFRLKLLAETENNLSKQDPRGGLIEKAILDTTQVAEREKQERWQRLCDEADTEIAMGHLLVANDLIFQILDENPAHREAQQQLSDLQSRLHFVLEKGTQLSSPERFSLEGFYAYGQADYSAATTAWEKARAIIRQSRPPEQVEHDIAALRFEHYEQIAQTRLKEEHQLVEAESLFAKGIDQYQKSQFDQALDLFRQVAIINPEYPQLGDWLTRSEASAEKERTARLGEKKMQEEHRLYEKGVLSLEHAQYEEAEKDFIKLLTWDPNNHQARSYLAMAQAELNKSHDPKAAQQHYEAGLIAYASGKLEDAVHEWQIATRMNPHHEKAVIALNKVYKELAFNRETLP